MSDNRALYTEEAIIGALKRLLMGRVNEVLGELDYAVPLVDFSYYGYGYDVVPLITIASCERTEKERIICLDTYSIYVDFPFSDTPESELYCYAYASAVALALRDDVTLGGIADRAVITGRKYIKPKTPHCGEGWALSISLRVTVEGFIE